MPMISGDFVRRRRNSLDDELPPPPVSPPRASRTEGPEAPGLLNNYFPRVDYFATVTSYGVGASWLKKPDTTMDPQCIVSFILTPDGKDPELYSVWDCSAQDLGEFGIGVGLYYRQLLLLGIVILICAMVYIPSVVYNASFNHSENTSTLLTGTAHNASREDLSLAYNGVPDLIVTLLLVIFAASSWSIEQRSVKAIDTSQLTPPDYTVCIHQPPTKLTDPDKYYDKFNKFGKIVFITICLDNGTLMKAVAKKSLIEHKLKAIASHKARYLGDEKEMDKINRTRADLSCWQSILQAWFGLFETEDYLNDSLEAQKNIIAGLAQRVYEPTRVYITFEREQDQRACLEKTETGLCEAQLKRFKRRGVNTESIIEGELCRILPAEEPTEVLWQHVHVPFLRRLWRFLISGFISAMFLGLGFLLLLFVSGGGIGAAVLIAFVNAILPVVLRVLTLVVEEHRSLTTFQASLMFKLVITRGINSAFLLFIITDFTERLDSDHLTQILSILIVDAFSTPFLRLTNAFLADLIGRKFLGAKKRTQVDMNVYFQGVRWNLAERYTDVIKTVFVGLFFSAIVPTGLIVTAIAMCTLYWVDKYCLLRRWRRPPAYDESLSSQARWYIVLGIWLHLFMARIYFAGWPNLNDSEQPDCGFFSCNDDADEGSFYTKDQRQIVNVYEILGFLVFAFGGIVLLLWFVRHFFSTLVIKSRKTVFGSFCGENLLAKSEAFNSPYWGL